MFGKCYVMWFYSLTIKTELPTISTLKDNESTNDNRQAYA